MVRRQVAREARHPEGAQGHVLSLPELTVFWALAVQDCVCRSVAPASNHMQQEGKKAWMALFVASGIASRPLPRCAEDGLEVQFSTNHNTAACTLCS